MLTRPQSIWNYPDEKKVDNTSSKNKQAVKPNPTAPSRPTIRRRAINPHSLLEENENDNDNDNDHYEYAMRLRRALQDRRDALQAQPPRTQPSRTVDPMPQHLPTDAQFLSDARIDANAHSDTHSDTPQPSRRYRVARDRRRQQPAEPDMVTAARRSLRRRQRYHDFAPYLLERARPLSSAQAALLPSPSEILARADSSAQINLSGPSLDSSAPPPVRQDSHQEPVIALPSTQRPRTLSPDNGLGDRRRSASPSVDVWQVMRNTITPDDALPSAASSFASAAAATASVSWNPPGRVDELTTSAPDPPPAVDAPAAREISFEETMREMGIEVSSSEGVSAPASASESSDDSMSESTEDEDHNHVALGENELRLRLRDQRRIADRLYDIAMTTAEGREQVESVFGPGSLQHGYLDTSRFLASSSRHVDLAPPEMTASGVIMEHVYSGPDLGPEIHARARDAASQTRNYFGRYRDSGDSGPASRYPYGPTRRIERVADASQRRTLRSATPPTGSHLLNPATGELTFMLDRDMREVERTWPRL